MVVVLVADLIQKSSRSIIQVQDHTTPQLKEVNQEQKLEKLKETP